MADRDVDRPGLPGRRRAGATLGALLATAALAGCGVSTTAVSTAVGGVAQVAHAITQLSQHELRAWCPAAIAGGGRQLTQPEARDCLKRAWHDWLAELKRDGYDPSRIGRQQ